MRARDTFFGVDKRRSKCFKRLAGWLLIPEIVRQRCKSLFSCNHRLGAALRFIGEIEIFQFTLVERLVDTRPQLVCQLALFLNGRENRLFAGDQLTKIEQLFFDSANLEFVEIASRLLAIAGYKGNG